MLHAPRRFAAVVLLAAWLPGTASAAVRYQEPSPAIVRILDAAPPPVVLISPDRTKLLLLEPAALPTRAELQRPGIDIAGIRINPRNTAATHLATYTAVIARPIGRGETRRIVIPWKAQVANPVWSPDGQRIAFSVVEDAGLSLWVAEARSGESRMLVGPKLNGVLGNPCQWLPESDGLLCREVVARRPTAPAVASDTSDTPVEAGIEQYLSSQLVLIPLSGSERPIGAPGFYSHVDLSPDGSYLLVESLHRPYPAGLPRHRLPARTELWDISGAVLKVMGDRSEVAHRPQSADEVPAGPRRFEWRNDTPATLVWVEALDGGDPSTAAPVRDRMLQLTAPFSGAPTILLEVQGRFQEAVWGSRDLAIVTESWFRTGRTRTWMIDPRVSGGAPKLWSERDPDDRYGDPGRFITGPGPHGRPVLYTSRDGRFAFLAGAGASPTGDRPFLDRLALATRKQVRLWRSEGAYHEEAIALLDPDADLLITRRESISEPLNYFIRDLRKPGAGRLSALTHFEDPSPEYSGVSRQLITFKRPDGVSLSAILYLPAGYRAARGPLPFVLWASTQLFRDTRTASQVPGSPHRFARPNATSPLFFLERGYGVLELSGIPIVAEGKQLSKARYLEQLVSGVKAVVERVVAMGVADSRRLGIGGDVSGGVAADLLEHSELFRAGITETRAESDGVASTVLFKPADANRRQLLVLLPLGDSGPTRESVAQRLAEMTSWMDKYLKAPPKTP